MIALERPRQIEGAGEQAPEPPRLDLLPRDWFDVAALIVFAVLSIWLLVSLASKSGPNHIWTGTDGPYIGDQMQYLGWIQDAGHHVLIGNPFDTKNASGDFLNPFLLVSGVLTRLGLSAASSYLVWKPLAVIVFFVAVRAYVHRYVAGTAQRRCALVIALFFVSPVSAFIVHVTFVPPLDRFVVPVAANEIWPILYLWGYPLTAIAVGSMCLCFLCYERDRSLGRVTAVAPLLGLLCAWLQPWQGATILGVLVASEFVMWMRTRTLSLRLLATTGTCTALPLIYFWALDHFDPVWRYGGVVDQSNFPILGVLIAIAPLAIPALIAYRLPTPNFQAVIVRLWPVVALIEFQLINSTKIGTFGLHSLQGLSVPLAVLAVVGVASLKVRLPRPMVVVISSILVVLILVPEGWKSLNSARGVGTGIAYASDPYFITKSDQDALDYLSADKEPGSVLAPIYLGQLVPGATGRHTWVGIYSWTPDYQQRVTVANELFTGKLSATEVTRFIRSSGVNFLLSDCGENSKLSSPDLVLTGTEHFGCATVYEVKNR